MKLADLASKIKHAFTKADLDLQTAQVVGARRVIDAHPSNHITPAKLKTMFDDAERGKITEQHALFLDIEERDSAIAANLDTRKRALLTLDWRIVPPRDASAKEQALTDELTAYFDSLNILDDVIFDLMDAVGHGFVALEIDWQNHDGKWYQNRFIHRSPTWFTRDGFDALRLTRPNSNESVELSPLGWVIHHHKSRSSRAARSGLFRTLAWLYMFKHYSIHDFAEFLELYGMPIRVGRYHAASTKEERRTLLRALADIGHNAAGIMPEGMQIELHDTAKGAGGDVFMRMVEWCEKSCARLILGQTLTTGSDDKTNTNALGNVHNEVREDLKQADARQIAQVINAQIIEPWLRINYSVATDTRLPYFEFDLSERGDLIEYAEALPKLADVGMQIPLNWAHERLGVPLPADDEPILSASVDKNSENASDVPTTELRACQCGQCQSVALTASGDNDAQSILDEEIEKALGDADFANQLNPLLKTIIGEMLSASSYEDAQARLIQLYPRLDNSAATRYLEQALFITDMLGRHDAK